jgi:hypothetical protein
MVLFSEVASTGGQRMHGSVVVVIKPIRESAPVVEHVVSVISVSYISNCFEGQLHSALHRIQTYDRHQTPYP